MTSKNKYNKWGLKNFWCICNKYNLWENRINTYHCNQHLFDPYSFCHMEWGAIQYLLLKKYGYRVNLLFHFIWEIIENCPYVINHFRSTPESREYEGDSIANAIGDLLSFSIGYLSMKNTHQPQQKLVIILLLELIPYLLIKQNTFILVKSTLSTALKIEG